MLQGVGEGKWRPRLSRHCKNPVPAGVTVRSTVGSDLSIATAAEISPFPSASLPSAGETAGERRFARVTLAPK